MRSLYSSIQDYVISVFTIVLAGLVLWAAQDIPPPFFDPLGSAAVPKACAYLLIILALAISVRNFFRNKASANSSTEDEGFKREPILGIAVVALSVLYILSMGAGWVGFRWGTILYIAITGSLLAKGNKRVMLISLAFGLLFGFGGQHLFTDFFYIDLPQ
ncbi:MAG: tripartite tricarboxylate transporter TctB family protein [Verrucomicrobia bacterium]|nr:tripartite tricarboxylate transporter TctB family protein [Verrucomicrobiota bacterium]MDA1067228.1 tripartite tricarboxylate transporter TctB family protein [Verrucomicrobiota bacterium]